MFSCSGILWVQYIKKTIKYRVSYSGTKETDILYKRYFINQLDKFTEKDLEDIKSIFNQFSDNEIYDFLTSKVAIPLEFEEIFNKILNEE